MKPKPEQLDLFKAGEKAPKPSKPKKPVTPEKPISQFSPRNLKNPF